jgi:hypothetical protein
MRWPDLLFAFAAVSLLFPVTRTLASTVETMAVDLLRQNGDPDHTELAGFVVLGETGELELRQWPVPEKPPLRMASWLGPLPARLVAVIHTHPRKRPRPSNQDSAEARRLGVPFYVVSQQSLCVAAADGDIRCRRHGA